MAAAMLALLGGCDNRSASTTASAPAETGASASADQARQVCYRQLLGRDTTLVRLNIRGAAVTGELAVLPAEKDKARDTAETNRADQLPRDVEGIASDTANGGKSAHNCGEGPMQGADKQGRFAGQNKTAEPD